MPPEITAAVMFVVFIHSTLITFITFCAPLKDTILWGENCRKSWKNHSTKPRNLFTE